MVIFSAEIERFERMGEKTGWTYVFIPGTTANQIKPDCRKSYRVRGLLDQVEVSGLAMVPMGEGNFIVALNAALRRQLKKEEGAVLTLQLEEDVDFKVEMAVEMELVLMEESQLMERFMQLPKSHQNYYINWFNEAKTETTRVKRLTMLVKAMEQRLNFGEMIRAAKNK